MMPLLAMMGLFGGSLASDPPKPLNVIVPTLDELRSFLPTDLRADLSPVDPKQDGRLKLTLDLSKLNPGELTSNFRDVASIRANQARVEADLRPDQVAVRQAVEASKCRDWSRIPNASLKSLPLPETDLPDLPTPPFPEFASLKFATRILAAQARLDLVRHDSKATEEYLAILRLGALFSRGRQGLVGYLVGRTILSFGFSAIMLDARSMPDPMLRVILHEIPDSADSTRGLVGSLSQDLDDQFTFLQFVVGQMAHPKDAKDPVWQALQGHPRPFDVADTVRIMSAIGHANAESASHPERRSPKPSQVKEALLRDLPETPWSSADEETKWPPAEQFAKQLRAVRNPLGRLFCTVLGTFDDLSGVVGYQLADVRAFRIALACELYRRSHSKFPATLKDLVAVHLIARIPADPFDLKPMRYDPKRAILWTIGPDRKDSGGHDKPWTRPKEGIGDLVYPLDGHKEAR